MVATSAEQQSFIPMFDIKSHLRPDYYIQRSIQHNRQLEHNASQDSAYNYQPAEPEQPDYPTIYSRPSYGYKQEEEEKPNDEPQRPAYPSFQTSSPVYFKTEAASTTAAPTTAAPTAAEEAATPGPVYVRTTTTAAPPATTTATPGPVYVKTTTAAPTPTTTAAHTTTSSGPTSSPLYYKPLPETTAQPQTSDNIYFKSASSSDAEKPDDTEEDEKETEEAGDDNTEVNGNGVEDKKPAEDQKTYIEEIYRYRYI